MGSKKFYEHAQNLLGGVKCKVGNLTLGGNMGLYCVILKSITFLRIIILCYKYYYIILLYYNYIIILYYSILLYISYN